jgi:hypothetical protein
MEAPVPEIMDTLHLSYFAFMDLPTLAERLYSTAWNAIVERQSNFRHYRDM